MRLPREPSNPERLKGFGYAEFDDLESLLRALSLNEEVRETNKLEFIVVVFLFYFSAYTSMQCKNNLLFKVHTGISYEN